MQNSAISTRRTDRMAATSTRLTVVARRLTAECGLNGFTIEQLCDEVGVSRRTFFNYFPSKEEAVMCLNENDQFQRFSDVFLSRGSRGWPAVVEDLADLAAEHARSAGFDRAEQVDLMAALDREPRLFARFSELSREREQQLADLIAAREGTATDDLRVHAAVQLNVAILRGAGELFIDRRVGVDFATAIHASLSAFRAVLASDSEQKGNL